MLEADLDAKGLWQPLPDQGSLVLAAASIRIIRTVKDKLLDITRENERDFLGIIAWLRGSLDEAVAIFRDNNNMHD